MKNGVPAMNPISWWPRWPVLTSPYARAFESIGEMAISLGRATSVLSADARFDREILGSAGWMEIIANLSIDTKIELRRAYILSATKIDIFSKGVTF